MALKSVKPIGRNVTQNFGGGQYVLPGGSSNCTYCIKSVLYSYEKMEQPFVTSEKLQCWKHEEIARAWTKKNFRCTYDFINIRIMHSRPGEIYYGKKPQIPQENLETPIFTEIQQHLTTPQKLRKFPGHSAK